MLHMSSGGGMGDSDASDDAGNLSPFERKLRDMERRLRMLRFPPRSARSPRSFQQEGGPPASVPRWSVGGGSHVAPANANCMGAAAQPSTSQPPLSNGDAGAPEWCRTSPMPRRPLPLSMSARTSDGCDPDATPRHDAQPGAMSASVGTSAGVQYNHLRSNLGFAQPGINADGTVDFQNFGSLPRRRRPQLFPTQGSSRSSSVTSRDPCAAYDSDSSALFAGVRKRAPLPTPVPQHNWTFGTDPNGFNGNRLSEASAHAERQLKEIMKQTGILRINGREYKLRTDDLVLVCDLGHGTCGHVTKMQHIESDTVMAVKQMHRTANTEENKRVIMDLDTVLRSNDCAYIVQCYGCFVTDYEVWICMELMATCFDKLLKRTRQPVPEPILGKMTVAVVRALDFLKQQRKIIHRDVKPSNILLDWDGTIKLCDFGIAGRLVPLPDPGLVVPQVDSRAQTRHGCVAYMSPERIEARGSYDIRADVWSLGLSLVELATGFFPYPPVASEFEMITRIIEDEPPRLTPSQGFSPEFCDFVSKCLVKNVEHRAKYRPTLLEHPFIQRYVRQPVDVGAWLRPLAAAHGLARTPDPLGSATPTPTAAHRIA